MPKAWLSSLHQSQLRFDCQYAHLCEMPPIVFYNKMAHDERDIKSDLRVWWLSIFGLDLFRVGHGYKKRRLTDSCLISHVAATTTGIGSYDNLRIASADSLACCFLRRKPATGPFFLASGTRDKPTHSKMCVPLFVCSMQAHRPKILRMTLFTLTFHTFKEHERRNTRANHTVL